ncbi:hypothetical protein MesoLjLb_31140 [Mesorhizobium sp. L-8-3]|nr:hypothetical protein MesoLjLb_31140 [Mesorhizobium sp. L-8-3]
MSDFNAGDCKQASDGCARKRTANVRHLPQAPTFQVAGHGIVGNLFAILPRLQEAL